MNDKEKPARCRYCASTDGCECHSGNRPKPGREDPAAFDHVMDIDPADSDDPAPAA